MHGQQSSERHSICVDVCVGVAVVCVFVCIPFFVPVVLLQDVYQRLSMILKMKPLLLTELQSSQVLGTTEPISLTVVRLFTRTGLYLCIPLDRVAIIDLLFDFLCCFCAQRLLVRSSWSPTLTRVSCPAAFPPPLTEMQGFMQQLYCGLWLYYVTLSYPYTCRDKGERAERAVRANWCCQNCCHTVGCGRREGVCVCVCTCCL